MKHLKLLMLAIATLVIAWSVFASDRGGVFTNSDWTSDGSIQSEMADSLNNYRESLGIARLQSSDLLDKAANKYACRMATNNFFGHIQPNGDGPFERVDAMWMDFDPIGENILYAPTARFNGTPWENSLALRKTSAEHNSNMTQASWNEAGFGYCSWYRVQIFVVNAYTKYVTEHPTFVCPYNTEKNLPYVMFMENRSRCYPAPTVDTSSTNATIVNKTTPVVKPTIKAKVLMVWNVTEAKFLANLNKIYGKKLNGKKLYLK